jgi:hypothetical protein
MIPIDLFDRDLRRIAAVEIPSEDVGDLPELVAWGSRFFVRVGHGLDYREVACLQVYTSMERAAMGGER